jgi:hypothetical protein
MNQTRFLQHLAEKHKLITRSEYHLQIEVGEHVYHNIWLDKSHRMRIKFAGNREVIDVIRSNMARILEQIDSYKHVESDYYRLKELENLLTKVENQQGIYCDAGFKDGKAKIAIIKVDNGDVDIHVRHIEADSPYNAECRAINLALMFHPPHTKNIIYSDCLEAVQAFNKLGHKQIKWINRKENKEADKLANMRG